MLIITFIHSNGRAHTQGAIENLKTMTSEEFKKAFGALNGAEVFSDGGSGGSSFVLGQTRSPVP
jgi:hypothetical protein